MKTRWVTANAQMTLLKLQVLDEQTQVWVDADKPPESLPPSVCKLLMKNEFVLRYEEYAGDKAIEIVYARVGDGWITLLSENMNEVAQFRDFGKGFVMTSCVTNP
jgi:hypothetical protein